MEILSLEKTKNSAELQQLVCDLGLSEYVAHTSQTEPIRAAQALHGNEPCFSIGKRYDCAEICEWRQNCRKPKAVWLR